MGARGDEAAEVGLPDVLLGHATAAGGRAPAGQTRRMESTQAARVGYCEDERSEPEITERCQEPANICAEVAPSRLQREDCVRIAPEEPTSNRM